MAQTARCFADLAPACRAILADLLLNGTGIPPESFSIAPALLSGEFTAPPTYVVHGT